MRYFKKMTGNKCYLSPINIEDYPLYTKWMNDLEVTRGLGFYTQNFPFAVERETLDKISREHSYAIIDLMKDEVIGNCGLFDINHLERNGSVGIFIGNKDFWNKGYGREALSLIIQFGFDYLNLRNIMLKVFSFNERAIRSYLSIGFKEIGRRRKSIVLNGIEYDDVYMDILDDEFRKLNK